LKITLYSDQHNATKDRNSSGKKTGWQTHDHVVGGKKNAAVVEKLYGITDKNQQHSGN
jgi:hypothetical protein